MFIMVLALIIRRLPYTIRSSVAILQQIPLSWVTMISELSTAIILYTEKTKTLTVAVYTEVLRGNYGIATALSTILTLTTISLLLMVQKLNKGKEFTL